MRATKSRLSTMLRAAFPVWLDGEGVFEFFHPRLQVIEALLLLGQERVLDLVQADSMPSNRVLTLSSNAVRSSFVAVVLKPSLIMMASLSTAFSMAASTSCVVAGILLMVFIGLGFITW